MYGEETRDMIQALDRINHTLHDILIVGHTLISDRNMSQTYTYENAEKMLENSGKETEIDHFFKVLDYFIENEKSYEVKGILENVKKYAKEKKIDILEEK